MIEQGTGPWRLRLICCGREDGLLRFETSDEADAFRESYTTGVAVAWHGYSSAAHEPGHRRAAIKELVGLSPESAPPVPQHVRCGNPENGFDACTCGWKANCYSWRAHAAWAKKRGESVLEGVAVPSPESAPKETEKP